MNSYEQCLIIGTYKDECRRYNINTKDCIELYILNKDSKMIPNIIKDLLSNEENFNLLRLIYN